MDDILRSHLDISKVDRMYRCVCLSCGAFVAASTSLERLNIAERQHRCIKTQPTKALVDTRALVQTPGSSQPKYR